MWGYVLVRGALPSPDQYGLAWTLGQIFLNFTCEIFQRKHKHVFTCYVIPPHGLDASGLNLSSCKAMTYLFYIVNITGVDVLAPCVARTSSTMICTLLDRINSVPARWGLDQRVRLLKNLATGPIMAPTKNPLFNISKQALKLARVQTSHHHESQVISRCKLCAGFDTRNNLVHFQDVACIPFLTGFILYFLDPRLSARLRETGGWTFMKCSWHGRREQLALLFHAWLIRPFQARQTRRGGDLRFRNVSFIDAL